MGVQNERVKYAWLALGWICVGLGGIGFVVPGLPSTVFFIGAAACFSRSSPRFEQWVLDLPTIGPLVSDYRAGRGMPRRAKVVAVGTMWTAILISVISLGPGWISAVIVSLGLVGSWYILVRTPTKALA